MSQVFDRDYYERGLETGKSCFQNYRWIPELTIPLAMTLVDYLGIKRGQSVLDFGCAKGYLVKALRLLHREAYGVDISRYAIENADPAVRQYVRRVSLVPPREDLRDFRYDFCIAKDVFEHIDKKQLPKVLKGIFAKVMFVCVPLGEGGCYNAPINNLDTTHVVCEEAEWWMDLFLDHGWTVKEFVFRVDGIKDSYSNIDRAHGFFRLEKKCSVCV